MSLSKLDSGWVRFGLTLLIMVVSFTAVVTTRDNDITSLQNKHTELKESVEESVKSLSVSKASQEQRLIRIEVQQQMLQDDVQEISQDVKTLVRRNSN